jgi:hypothetical protein
LNNANTTGGSAGGIIGGIASIFGFAEGGHIRGPGTGTSDSIPAMVSNGEFIVNARATRQWAPFLQMINSGRVPKFAAGGVVSGSPAIRRISALPGEGITLAPNLSMTFQAKGEGFDPRQARGASEALKAETAKFMEKWVQNELRPGGRLASRR